MGTIPAEGGPLVLFNVVVVDDDPLMRLVIELVFEEDPRFRFCWSAGSVERALSLAATERREIDLVVLDDVLAGTAAGRELAATLARLWPDARIVGFSAGDEHTGGDHLDAWVPKTEPELLLDVARGMVGVGAEPAGGAPGAAPSSVPAAAVPTRSVAPLGGVGVMGRLAVAAAVAFLLAAGVGAPAPRQVVSRAVAFVARIVPDADDTDDGRGGDGRDRRSGERRPAGGAGARPGTGGVPAPAPSPAPPEVAPSASRPSTGTPPAGGRPGRGPAPRPPGAPDRPAPERGPSRPDSDGAGGRRGDPTQPAGARREQPAPPPGRVPADQPRPAGGGATRATPPSSPPPPAPAPVTGPAPASPPAQPQASPAPPPALTSQPAPAPPAAP